MRLNTGRLFVRGLQYFSRLSYGSRVLFCVMLVFLVTYLDFLTDILTGVNASPVMLFLLPIALGSWFLRPGEGVRLAVLSGLVYLVSNLLKPGHYLTPYVYLWNALSDAVLFFLFARVIEGTRNLVDTQRTLARVDPLTCIGNRRAFYEALEAETMRAQRWQSPLAVAFLDIDRFKALNDKMGHERGDLLLKQTATLLKDNLRATDAVARLGGDEFAFLLVGSGATVVRKVVEKIHYGLHGMAMANEWPVSFSIGVVTCLSAPKNPTDMLEAADELMYSVKREHGGAVRHRVIEPAPRSPALEPAQS